MQFQSASKPIHPTSMYAYFQQLCVTYTSLPSYAVPDSVLPGYAWRCITSQCAPTIEVHRRVMQSDAMYADMVYPSRTSGLRVTVCGDFGGMHPPAYFVRFC